MKVKRATEQDRQALWGVINILSSLYHNDTLITHDSDEELSFDCSVYHFCQDTEDDNDEVAFLKKALFALLRAYDSGDCEAAALNLDVLLSPENNLVDQNDTILDFSPDLKRMLHQTEQSAWISVDDALPEKAGEYLIAIKEVEPTVFGKDVRYRVAIKYINHNSWSAYATGTISINDKITH